MDNAANQEKLSQERLDDIKVVADTFGLDEQQLISFIVGNEFDERQLSNFITRNYYINNIDDFEDFDKLINTFDKDIVQSVMAHIHNVDLNNLPLTEHQKEMHARRLIIDFIINEENFLAEQLRQVQKQVKNIQVIDAEYETVNQKEDDTMSKFDISARVNPLGDQTGNVKAMASVTIDNVIAINSLAIVEDKSKNPFVSFPKLPTSDGGFRDIVEFQRDSSGKMTKASVELKDAINKLLVDMYKSGQRSTPEKSEPIPIIHDVKALVTPLTNSESATKGIASVQVGDFLRINSIRINENTKESSDNFGKNFVSMPSRPDKTTESGYRDVVHPVNAEFREKLNGAILKQYDNQLAWKQHKEKKQQPQNKDKESTKETKKTNRDER